MRWWLRDGREGKNVGWEKKDPLLLASWFAKSPKSEKDRRVSTREENARV